MIEDIHRHQPNHGLKPRGLRLEDFVRGYDAVWASPPCQSRSPARTQGEPSSPYARDHLQWCLNLKAPVLWVENIKSQVADNNLWGTLWNFAQLDPQDPPRQSRNRVVGGRHLIPPSVRPYRKSYEGVATVDLESIIICTILSKYSFLVSTK